MPPGLTEGPGFEFGMLLRACYSNGTVLVEDVFRKTSELANPKLHEAPAGSPVQGVGVGVEACSRFEGREASVFRPSVVCTA